MIPKRRLYFRVRSAVQSYDLENGVWFILYLCIVKIDNKNTFERIKNMADTIEFRYDTQLLIDAQGLDEDEIFDYISDNFVGDSLLVIADDDVAKLHFHTNEPWKILEYCRTLGEIYDIVVEDMDRQARGLKG